MEHVIDDLIQERCDFQQAQIQELEKQIGHVEQRMDEEGEEKIFVPSQLHFV